MRPNRSGWRPTGMRGPPADLARSTIFARVSRAMSPTRPKYETVTLRSSDVVGVWIMKAAAAGLSRPTRRSKTGGQVLGYAKSGCKHNGCPARGRYWRFRLRSTRIGLIQVSPNKISANTRDRLYMALEIQKLDDLISLLRDRISTDNRVLWFRGHRDATWTLSPTVKRGYDSDGERNLTHRFRSRAGVRHARLPAYDDLASWLALMQHYGLPTRLLDWTRSPMIALFFALDGSHRVAQPSDASLWILEPHALNEAQGFEPVTAALNAWMYSTLVRPAYYHQDPEPGTVAAAMASETDQRMFVQQGCFT
jgi:hypothetical protein